MPTPLLATKLYIPRSRPDLVRRARLLERLDAGLTRKLTLISAPAGFGKTTVVSTWIDGLRERDEEHVAWLSLDPADQEPARFLSYLVAALQTVAPAVGQGVTAALQSPQPPPVESMLTALLNELAPLPHDLVLVLDDYHVVDAQAIDQALTFLLEHMPPHMHLVITTREDPDLPLPRLRVRDQLVEVRAADLRFSPAEASDFFRTVMRVDLTPEDVAVLEARTEGWIAGLQLAALSMRGRADVHGFIQAFAGENRYVVDYLVEEVLQRQPESVRTFLLQTSILTRLTGPLCDAVTGQTDSGAQLESLERNNLFVIPLDDARRWYRYHHLFADVLQAHLLEEQPALTPVLHARASDWYAAHGDPAAAIEHALAAADASRAATLLELVWREMDQSLQATTWLGWARQLPAAEFDRRPVLSVGLAWALLNEGLLEEAVAQLAHAERLLTATPSPEQAENSTLIIVDEWEFRSLPASIATARAYHAQALGDRSASERYARQALADMPAENYVGRAIPGALVGLAQWTDGQLEAAYATLLEALHNFQRAGNDIAKLSMTYGLADMRIAQGRLHDARRVYTEAQDVALALGDPAPRGTAEIYLGLAELSCEQGDLSAADAFMEQSWALGEQAALPDWQYRVRVGQARLADIRGDFDGALSLLDQAEGYYFRSPVPLLRPFAAQRARIRLRQGHLDAAAAWARDAGVTPDDELSFLREFEHITLARVLLARLQREGTAAAAQAASALLTRLLHAADAGKRNGSVIEILVLLALAHQAQGDDAQALACLARALTLAEPEGYVRVFVDEGPAMDAPLQAAAAQGIAPAYVGRLRAAFGQETLPPATPPAAPQVHRPVATLETAQPPVEPLIEPLSEREESVLRLLATELSGPEIAQELIVSLNTMRTHTKNIYSKLGVNSRRAAVRRAQELNLL